MSQQSSQTSALEWKPTPQPPSRNFLDWLTHPPRILTLATIPTTNPGYLSAPTQPPQPTAPGLQGHQLSQKPPGEIPQWISGFGRGGGGWDRPLSHC